MHDLIHSQASSNAGGYSLGQNANLAGLSCSMSARLRSSPNSSRTPAGEQVGSEGGGRDSGFQLMRFLNFWHECIQIVHVLFK